MPGITTLSNWFSSCIPCTSSTKSSQETQPTESLLLGASLAVRGPPAVANSNLQPGAANGKHPSTPAKALPDNLVAAQHDMAPTGASRHDKGEYAHHGVDESQPHKEELEHTVTKPVNVNTKTESALVKTTDPYYISTLGKTSAPSVKAGSANDIDEYLDSALANVTDEESPAHALVAPQTA